MVYGAAFWAIDDEPELAAWGFDDSKVVTADKRGALFERMRASPRLGWVVHSITAREISSAMLHR